MDTAINSTESSGAITLGGVRVRWQWLIPLGIALLAILLYANTFRFDMFYSWDDNRYLRENELIKDFSLQGLVNIYTRPYFAAYIPVTLTSYWLEYHFWQLQPSGYHVVNTALHALNGALVYSFLNLLLRRRAVALLAAVLFVVHPLQVESVAWIAERKNLLAMTFMLMSFIAHIRSADKTSHRAWLPLTWVLYLAAALSKPAVVGVPVLFILYDYFWARLSLREIAARNVVPLLIGAASAILIIVTHEEGGGIKTYRGGTFFTSQALMFTVWWQYLVSFVWPLNLNNYYQFNWPEAVQGANAIQVVLGAILFFGSLAIAGWLLVRFFRASLRNRESSRKTEISRPALFLMFAIIWTWLFMAPVANIVPIAIERADRYMYFPAVVIFALVGLGLEWLWQRLNAPAVRAVLTGVVVLVIAGFTVVTVQRTWAWEDEGALWRDHLEDYPTSQTGWLNLGVYYYNIRDYDNATPAFERLLELSPNHLKGNRFMGNIAVNEGRHADAIPYYQRAAQTGPNDYLTHYYLGLAYYNLNQYPQAVASYRRALQLNENISQAYANLGLAAVQTRDYELAREALLRAIGRDPNNAELLGNLCIAQASLDRVVEAIDSCRRATEIVANNPYYHGLLGNLYMLNNQPAEALASARAAIELDPNRTLSFRVLGDALRAQGDTERAVAAYARALDLDPNNQRAREGYAALTAEAGQP